MTQPKVEQGGALRHRRLGVLLRPIESLHAIHGFGSLGNPSYNGTHPPDLEDIVMRSPRHRFVLVSIAAICVLLGALVACAEEGFDQAVRARARDNLAAFARLYGAVRWFHPSDECGDADWDAIAIQGVLEARAAAEIAEGFADRLEAVFAPVAPTVRVFPADLPDEIPAALRPPETSGTLEAIRWEHKGLGTSLYRRAMPTAYQSRRLSAEVPSDGPPGDSWDPAIVQLLLLNDELAAWVPTVLYADGAGTLPHTSDADQPPSDVAGDADAQTMMLADAVVIWNVMQHFYPYFVVVDVDWSHQLERTLEHILDLGVAYTRSALKVDLIVPLDDGHAGIYDAEERAAQFFPELGISSIGGSLVVTAAGSRAQAEGIGVGDVITTIGGVSAAEALESVRARYSGSSHYRTVKGWMNVLEGASGTHVDLELQTRGGETYAATLERTQKALLEDPRPETVCWLESGIGYVDIGRVTVDQMQSADDDFASASSIIIDARGYPSIPFWSSYFLRETRPSMQILTPIYRQPNQVNTEYIVQQTQAAPRGSWPESPGPDLVFLIDARAVSAAEHQLSVFKCAGIGTFVGAPTAGANGNINLLDLPSGVGVTWAGMIAQWPNGSTFHAIGIRPDVFVTPTLRGVAEGRDEVLESALRYLRNRTASGSAG